MEKRLKKTKTVGEIIDLMRENDQKPGGELAVIKEQVAKRKKTKAEFLQAWHEWPKDTKLKVVTEFARKITTTKEAAELPGRVTIADEPKLFAEMTALFWDYMGFDKRWLPVFIDDTLDLLDLMALTDMAVFYRRVRTGYYKLYGKNIPDMNKALSDFSKEIAYELHFANNPLDAYHKSGSRDEGAWRDIGRPK